MITEDQTAVIELLASPATHGGVPVERIDTHSSAVFLAGDRAYKLKRAVRFDYLDFSTAERRRTLCELEILLNRRSAPTLYRRTIAITRQRDGTLRLGGSGEPRDWVVEMTRFPQEHLLDRVAASGRLDLELMRSLGSAIAGFHKHAERRYNHGGVEAMRWVVDGNAAGFAEFGATCLDAAACARVTDAARARIDRDAAVLDSRRRTGFVRQCHGDLHLRNIVLLEGRPTLFDGVEFNDEISCIDVLYDLGFLLMDLWRRRLPRHANAVWNRYLVDSADVGGVSLMPLFLSCRAAVRAKTSATAAQLQVDDGRRAELETQAGEYLSLAETLLQPPAPCLIAIGGLSGSGKSTLAATVAPLVGAVPGALVLRSDEIRKELCGVAPLDRLGPEGYSAAVSERVYQVVAERAGAALRGGHSAIADAVYVRSEHRDGIARVAATLSAPFIGLWLEAPDSTLIARVDARRTDPSDADASVVRQQRVQFAGDTDWLRLDASGPAEGVRHRVLDHLDRHSGASLNPGRLWTRA